ncbi:unnamed protein product [Adineta ricciae]|uniref:Mos1 transposase HTH domain-containing protein n=1 Tax=Adineta ricciae TaxID=249248 RepID=A0A815UU11_ADIRI|nr:unnamed protein product [Adineta ricciae]
MDKLSVRSYIKTRSLLGLTATEIHDELVTAYGPYVVSYCTVARWIRRFSSGRESFYDDHRVGRPITTVTQRNIDAVQDLVLDDPHISIEYIVDILQISHGNGFPTSSLLHNDNCVLKYASTICGNSRVAFGDWVTLLLETRVGSTIVKSNQSKLPTWIPKEEPPPTVVRRQQFEQKTMFVVFFMTTGPLLVHYLASGTSINGTYYRDECLKTLVRNLCEKRPSAKTRGIQLHHDNARPHVSGIVLDYLREVKLNVMAHPPYSPDLAPSDFWLFTRLKRNLGTYPDARSLARGITMELNSIPIEEYQKTCHKWIERMKLCVEHQGNYLEHLM